MTTNGAASQPEISIVLDIVETCLYSPERISTDYLAVMSRKLDKDTFVSIADELSVNNKCGYVACKNTISAQNIATQQLYRIVRNRVYDLSERRKFCSDQCYAFYMQILDQLDDTPQFNRVIYFPDVSNSENVDRSSVKPGNEIDLKMSVQIENSLKDLKLSDQTDPIADRGVASKSRKVDGKFLEEGQLENEDVVHLNNEEMIFASGSSDSGDLLYTDTRIPTSQSSTRTNSDLNSALVRIRQKYYGGARAKVRHAVKSVPIIDPLSLTVPQMSNDRKLGTSAPLKLDNVKWALLEWTFIPEPKKSISDSVESGEKALFTPAINSSFGEDLGTDARSGANYANLAGQMDQRRKIVLDKLQFALRVICDTLQIKMDDVLNDIKTAVLNLQFSPNNINLSSKEWIACGLLLLIKSNPLTVHDKKTELDSLLCKLGCNTDEFYIACDFLNKK